ncbi:MAG: hypothetical protein ACFFG0_03285 [Candidatus Thorarchaeota archaeon]
MERIKITKTGKSQFGYYLMDDNSKFTSCTEQVSGFLSKQVPCEIEVEEVGEKNLVTRVKVVSNLEQPSATAQETKELPNYYETQDKRQESIENQMSVYAAIQMIEAHNKVSESKIEPTMNNLLTNAQIVKQVLNALKR